MFGGRERTAQESVDSIVWLVRDTITEYGAHGAPHELMKPLCEVELDFQQLCIDDCLGVDDQERERRRIKDISSRERPMEGVLIFRLTCRTLTSVL